MTHLLPAAERMLQGTGGPLVARPQELQKGIDLATALGMAPEEIGLHPGATTITICNDRLWRQRYWAFLAQHGLGGRTLQEAHPRALLLLAHDGIEDLGAAALIPDSRLGLALPPQIMPTIEGLRRDGRTLALLDPLVAVSTPPNAMAGLVLRALLRVLILAARRIDGVTDLLVHCEPRYARFFCQALLFQVACTIPDTPEAKGHQLLRLDLDLCGGDYVQRYGDNLWSPYTRYIKPSIAANRLIHWLVARRTPPAPEDIVDGWLTSAQESQVDAAGVLALQQLYPGLEHLMRSSPGSLQPTTVRHVGTGPIPRIRTPLPW